MRIFRDTRFAVPKRNPDSHKGQNGLVLVIGGSKDYVGAPALAGLAALRAGCDMVKIAAPEKAAWAINALSPDLMTVKLKGEYIGPGHYGLLTGLAKKADVVLIGSGMSKVKASFLNRLLQGLSDAGIPLVVDADAIKLAKVSSLRNAILTPHARELELFAEFNSRTLLVNELRNRRLKDKDKITLIKNNLKDFFDAGNVLLLKGVHDLVISADKAAVVKGGNAGMTVGGTGDILAGLCAGYLAETADLFTSAGLASKECKRVGDALLKKSNFGFGFIASDFLGKIAHLRKAEVV